MNDLVRNRETVLAQIRAAETACGRSGTTLIAVGKTFPAADIRTLYAAGQRDFGENYIQEWAAKTEELADLPDMVWHIIGDVQSNKTRLVAEKAHWLHTLSRLKTAERLSAQRPPHLPPLNVCIEVNIGGETAKHGVPPEEALPLALAAQKLPQIEVRGLMCVAKTGSTHEALLQQFSHMQTLLAGFQTAGLPADVLSMGMSADLAEAVACGATHVRIGSAIFGGRPAPAV
ncbi:YggS family pyridoxal phosphate-dependent enzyme [Neisseria leonii]|uniref:Pyridoxal phosphate homeostasis protein n=1 Tax=Neisseria leonii TaxID=2995413 RepID=A0A9X4IBS5_9NEIS|nr:YggS family pyridoxal phosphate-dependent enzyme [Neisseria sp. 51.81]MDD9328720.1 YggS family pyridoxal phosphate-dependent enzyme [Neisseria sp. 51.81]